MVGFFRSWSVSGITTKAAQNSADQYRVGLSIISIEDYKSLIDQKTQNMVSIEVGRIIRAKMDFDDYVLAGDKRKHDEAVKFLVMIAAVMYGAEDRGWDWQAIRDFSQGLYGSMIDTPEVFRFQNLPVINNLIEEIKHVL